MTDLHCHILPGMDDGAADLETALKLLELESVQEVDRIALTSHFNQAKTSVDDFLNRRQQAYDLLRSGLDTRDCKIDLKLGSEIMYHPRLISEPVHRLCLEGTDVLLLELPTDQKPPFVRDTLEYLVSDGLIPVLAHVERYHYLMSDPRMLAEWVEMGVYAQVNGSTLVKQTEATAMAMKLIRWNLVHVIASDAHSLTRRPPILRQALREVEKKLGSQKAQRLQENADALFAGREPDWCKPHMPKRVLGHWL